MEIRISYYWSCSIRQSLLLVLSALTLTAQAPSPVLLKNFGSPKTEQRVLQTGTASFTCAPAGNSVICTPAVLSQNLNFLLQGGDGRIATDKRGNLSVFQFVGDYVQNQFLQIWTMTPGGRPLQHLADVPIADTCTTDSPTSITWDLR